MALIGLALFSAALTMVVAVFWLTLVPALPRIVALLAGEQAMAPAPQPTSARAVVRLPRRPSGMPAAAAWRAAA